MSLQKSCVDLFVKNLKDSPEVIQELIGEELINRIREDITKELKKKIYDDIVNNVSCMVSETLMHKVNNTLQSVNLTDIFPTIDRDQVHIAKKISDNIFLEYEERFLPSFNKEKRYCSTDDFDDCDYDCDYYNYDCDYNNYVY